MDNFQLDNYLSQAIFSNHTKFNEKPLTLTQGFSELTPKLLSDVIFPSLLEQSNFPCFLIARL